MLVKEVMTKKVLKIDHNDSIFDACMMYQKYKIGSLLVTKDDKYVGIITERNIIERTICDKKKPEDVKVGDVMSKGLITIHALEKLETAIDIMIKHNIKKLPVKVNEEVVGIITVTDISRARPDLSKRFMDSWVKQRWRD